jgi:hypothetical protein
VEEMAKKDASQAHSKKITN